MASPLWRLDGAALDGRLAPLDLVLEPGATALVGPSGAGKSSLLELLSGMTRPDRGRIERLAPSLYWVPQDLGLWPRLSVRAHLALVQPAPDERRIGELLEQFEIAHLAGALPARLSRGERTRLSVARALAAAPAVLLLDEPLAGLDPSRATRLWGAIRDEATALGASLIYASHEPRWVVGQAGRVLCLDRGALLHDGDPEALYHHPPSEALAWCLGEGNWLQPEEARIWLFRREPTACCFRPERLRVRPAADGPFEVVDSRFHGALGEIDLLEPESGQRRRFYHRPPADGLARGVRVALELALALLLLLLPIGCGPGDEPALRLKPARSFSLPPSGPRAPAPRSLATGLSGELLALDTEGRVLVYGPDGRLLRSWSMPDIEVGKPEGLCMLRDGRIVVADTHYHRLVFFDAQGKLLAKIGAKGRGPGQFLYPVAVVEDPSRNLYVAEYGSNDRIQKFDPQGQPIAAFGKFGTEPGQFQRPSGMVWHAGKLYIADAINNRVQVFTDGGKQQGVLGDVPLRFPYDIALGPGPSLLVVEYGAARITRLDMRGRLLGRYGGPGGGPGQFRTPWGLAAGAGGRIHVADTGNRRIVELAP